MERQQQHVGYLFPVLKSKDIVECLTELGLEITKDELLDPQKHKEKVKHIYAQLLAYCTGQEEFSANERMKEASTDDLHNNVQDISFFLALQSLMRTCRITQFSLRDLHHPTSKRLRVHLSGILNMVRHMESQFQVYAELSEPVSTMAKVTVAYCLFTTRRFQITSHFLLFKLTSASSASSATRRLGSCTGRKSRAARAVNDY